MTEFIKFKNWTVQIEREAFRRSISMTVAVDKPIRVRTNLLCSNQKILEFLNEKEKWIQKNLSQFEKIKQQSPVLSFEDGAQFPFMGRDVILKKVITLGAKDFFSIFEDQLLWHTQKISFDSLSSQSGDFLSSNLSSLKIQKTFVQAYQRYAISELQKRVQWWSVKMNLKPSNVKFNQPKSRWGSCSSQGVINLNWKLIVFKPEIIDYVIVHELSHLKHMNHSPSFWGLVAEFCPDYKILRTDLRKNFYTPKFLDLN